MPDSLFDSNVWVAAVFPTHPFHSLARKVLTAATHSDPVVFCRATQQSFLRLATTPALLKAYGAESFSNQDAISVLESLLALPQVAEREEPKQLLPLWKQLAAKNTASPKVWMDAYLAAFAITGGMRLVTFDQDFKPYRESQLNVLLLPE